MGSGGTGGTGGDAGGMGGGFGGAGGSGPQAVSVGKLDGLLVQTPCLATLTDDCPIAGWMYEGKTYPIEPSLAVFDTDHSSTKDILKFAVTGGEPGEVYLATMHFYGIMEAKNYGAAVTREAAPMRPGLNSPSNPPPFGWGSTPGAAVVSSRYTSYEIHVHNEKNEIVRDYYLNADSQEGHYTFVIDYERPIEIVAGGYVKVRIFDDNARIIKNCGTTGAYFPCASKAQMVPGISAAMPQVHVQQPGLGQGADNSGQWLAIDVTAIVPK